MRICKVWDSEYPWDVRAEKICRALTEAGHEVHLLARNRDDRPLEEQLPECRVHRLRQWRMLGKRLSAASMFPAFFNPRWARHIHRTAQRVGAEIILVRDLPLAPTATWAARRLKIPVVLDMAENYPAMMAELWTHGVRRPLDWLVRNPGLVAQVERWSIDHVDHILVVVDESRDRLAALGVDPRRMTVVGNTPPLERLRDPWHKPESNVAGESGALTLCYLGLLEASRGIDTMLAAMSLARTTGVPVRLVIIGAGREEAALRAQAAGLGLGPDYVEFRGYLPYDAALAVVKTADVGIVPHLANEFWNSTIPNKLFDYMAGGLPVLVSDAAPARRIVTETECGEVFISADPRSALAAAGRLQDRGARRRLGENGRRAIEARYNWEHDSRRLITALAGVLGADMGRASV